MDTFTEGEPRILLGRRLAENADPDQSIIRIGPCLGVLSTGGADGSSIEIEVEGRIEFGPDGKYLIYQPETKQSNPP